MQRSYGRLKKVFVLVVSFILIITFINNSTSILKLNYPLKYSDYVFTYAKLNNLDPYLVFSIIKAESNFKPDAISHKSARGLMQISEKTGKWGAERLDLKDFTVEKLYDPQVNISIGCWYLDKLKKEFNGDMDLIIAAYNGGSGNVAGWLKDRNLSNSGVSLERIPFKETENFVKKVKEFHGVYQSLYEKHIK